MTSIKRGDVKRRTEIIVEVDQIIIAKTSASPVVAWCECCAQKVRMITPDEAAIITQHSTRTIFRWVENGRVHFSESPLGSIRICLVSLSHIESV